MLWHIRFEPTPESEGLGYYPRTKACYGRCECVAVMQAFKEFPDPRYRLASPIHRIMVGNLLEKDWCDHGNDLPVPWTD